MAQRGLAAGYFKVEGANPPVVNKLVRPVIAQREGEEKYEDKVRAWMEYSTHGDDARVGDGAGSHTEPDVPDLMVSDEDVQRACDSPSPPSSSASAGSTSPTIHTQSPNPKSAGSSADTTLIDLEDTMDRLQLSDTQNNARVDPFEVSNLQPSLQLFLTRANLLLFLKDLIKELKRGYAVKRVAELKSVSDAEAVGGGGEKRVSEPEPETVVDVLKVAFE